MYDVRCTLIRCRPIGNSPCGQMRCICPTRLTAVGGFVRCISSRALRGSCEAEGEADFYEQPASLAGMVRSRLLHLAVLYVDSLPPHRQLTPAGQMHGICPTALTPRCARALNGTVGRLASVAPHCLLTLRANAIAFVQSHSEPSWALIQAV